MAVRTGRSAKVATEKREASEHQRRADFMVSRNTKDQLAGVIAGLNAAIAKQARELVRLRKAEQEASQKLAQYQPIDIAVNTLARLQVKRDLRRPRTPDDEGKRHEPDRKITHPRAIDAVLANLDEAIEKVGGLDAIEAEVRIEVEALEEERGKLLRLLGMDEHEWRAVKWRL